MTKQAKIDGVIALIRKLNNDDLEFCTRVKIQHYPLRYKVEENERIDIWSDNRGAFFLDAELLNMCKRLKIEIMVSTHYYVKPNGSIRDYPAVVLYV